MSAPSSSRAAKRPGAPSRAVSTEELVAGLETCALPAGAFKHRDHVRAAWHYLRREPLITATARFAATIRRFAEHQGAYDKYDELVTVAYMVLIEARRRADPEADWETFAARNPDLFTDGSALLRGCGIGAEAAADTPGASRSSPL